MKYSKPPISIAEQIELLKQRGLIIEDEARAAKYLETVGYFRLTGYMFHLQMTDGSHRFFEGTTFTDIITVYQFDKKLRYLLLEYIERIEVAMRSFLSNKFSANHGFFWYTQESLFQDKRVHTHITNCVRDYFDDPTEIYLKKFKSKYTGEPFPPSNMAMEILTFGQLSKMYEGLKNDQEKQEIGAEFNLPSSIFTSWLIFITNVRNICAHHSRLWNRKVTANRFQLPSREKYKFHGNLPSDFNTTLYGILAVLIRLLNAINPQHSLLNKFHELCSVYPGISLQNMGFPEDWGKSPAWG